MAWTSQILAFLVVSSVYAVYGQSDNPCEKGIDLGIIVDRTTSVGKDNFLVVKTALKDLVDKFVIAPNKTHVSLIFYALNPEQLFNFSDVQYHSNQQVKASIDAVPDELYTGTRTDLALMKAHDHVFQAGSGNRPQRINVLIVFTDGNTDSLSAPYSETVPPLEDKGVKIIAVGIGDAVDSVELQNITGMRGSILQVSDFAALEGKLDEIVAEVCTVNGGYTSWTPWLGCSATCGRGTRYRSRNCTNPEPIGNAENCDDLGPAEEMQECNIQDCDESVDGGYTRWTTWTTCSKPCGQGSQFRFRACSNPFPQANGKNCDELGPSKEIMPCNKASCKQQPAPCWQGLDLGIVIDTSVSIRSKNLGRLLQQFLPSFLDKFSRRTRVGLISYHREAEVRFNFKTATGKSRGKARTYFEGMPTKVDRQTRTDKALIAAYKDLFSRRAGDRGKKQNVLVTFTDGRAWPKKRITPFSKTVPPLKRQKQCHMVAVGFGVPSRYNRTQLTEIAGDNVVMIQKPKRIKNYIKKIKKVVCAVDGGYSQWSLWSLCSATCGVGVKVRGRVCDAPAPRKRGRDCTRLGASYQTEECNERECPPGPPPCTGTTLDVCLIVDTSLSVRAPNFVLVKSFLTQFVYQFDSSTHFSVITFAGEAIVHCKFSDSQCQSADGAHDLISQIPNKLSFGTFTDKALIAADKVVFTPGAGDRGDADNVLIIVTDGKANKKSLPYVETVPPLRDGKNVKMLAFGVGPSIREEDLNEMVGEKNWFYVKNFQDMGDRLNDITGVACPTTT